LLLEALPILVLIRFLTNITITKTLHEDVWGGFGDGDALMGTNSKRSVGRPPPAPEG
jgi:hypothetical protein